MRRVACCLLCCIATSIVSFAQEGEFRGVKRPNAGVSELKEGNNYLFAIGIDHYTKWLKLGNAVSDAQGIVQLLTENFGFTTPVAPLYNEQATKQNITKSLEKIRRMLKPEDNLVIFFAGHGHTRTDTVGKQIIESGYLIPIDGAGLESDALDTYFKIDHLLNRFSLYPSQHITVILDACHSGLALGSEASSFRAEVAYMAELESKVSRRVLTSARSEQLASDVGPRYNHSLFTGMLIDGMETGKADIDQNGLITTSELGLYLEQSVSDYSKGRQIPDFGSFRLDDRGEMTFELNNNSPSFLLTTANNQLRNGRVGSFLKTYKKIEALELPIDKTYALAFRYYILVRQIDKALAAVQERMKVAATGEATITDSESEGLAEKVPSLRHWGDIIESPNLDPEQIEVELIDSAGNVIQPASLDSLAVEYLLPNVSVYSFKITNKSDKPIYPYALFIDETGDLFPFLLLPHSEKFPGNEKIYREGLPSDTLTYTAPLFHAFGEGWFVDVKLFFTNKPFDYFVLSPVYMHVETYTEKLKRPEDMVSRTFRLVFR